MVPWKVKNGLSAGVPRVRAGDRDGVPMLLPDRAGPWTVDDVLALDEDASHRTEMVGGALLLTPAPASRTSAPRTAWPYFWNTPPTASRCCPRST